MKLILKIKVEDELEAAALVVQIRDSLKNRPGIAVKAQIRDELVVEKIPEPAASAKNS